LLSGYFSGGLPKTFDRTHPSQKYKSTMVHLAYCHYGTQERRSTTTGPNGEEFLLFVYHEMFGDEINESGEKAFIQNKESFAVIGGKRNICDTFSELAANVILVCQWQVETQ
jgi:hypothetical protein